MTRPAPRRPSRITTAKPRKIAGKNATTNDSARPAEPLARPEPARRPKPSVADRPAPVDDGARSPAVLTSPRLTRTLLVLVGVLVLLLLLQATWFLVNERRDVQVSPGTTAQTDAGEYQPITVPSGRPVVLDQLAVQEGVEAAAAAAQIMFTRDYKSYDEGVENAVTLMTDEFAKQYRKTTDDVRQESIQTKTQVEIRVVAQSVERANDAELEALVFLNQYTRTGEGEDASTTYTPYRAVLKMVHTDNGWLVDGVDTK